jgi:hypothetical protein
VMGRADLATVAVGVRGVRSISVQTTAAMDPYLYCTETSC